MTASVLPYEYPWRGAPDAPGANFALGDLIANLPRRLMTEGGVHIETLLAASGAIAGYAAQRALLTRLPARDLTPDNGFHVVRTGTGAAFFSGTPIDDTLVPLSRNDRDKLWPLAWGAAVAAGLDPGDVPALEPMFAHVAQTLGTEREGTCSFEDCRFQAPAKTLLKAVWPLALMSFSGELSGNALAPPVIVTQPWRPVIAAITANKMIRDAAGALPPLKALTIVMETAIYASKLPPTAVEARTPAALSAGTPRSPPAAPGPG